MNRRPLVWVLVAIAVLVLVPLLGMIGMMGMGMGTGMGAMMGGGMACCGGMAGWALVWMTLLAALIVTAIVLFVRSVSRS